MVQKLIVKNFTVFSDENIEFSKNLNIFMGENGAGKSHLLKLIYSILFASSEAGNKKQKTKAAIQKIIDEKLVNVFRTESLGHLASRKHGIERCEISLFNKDEESNIQFKFSNRKALTLDRLPHKLIDNTPAFIPTRELLSVYPGFVSLYDSYNIEFEETYRDMCILLGQPLLKGPREKKAKKLLEPIEKMMGGKLINEGGRFYLRTEGIGKLEIYLVAEGLRKMGMLARLIANGNLLDRGVLFWDEPEANLNPKLIKDIAELIFNLCRNGIQVFIGTHSLFLVREFEILINEKRGNVHAKYFNLIKNDNATNIVSGNSLSDMDSTAILDEELNQAKRFMEGCA